MKTHVVLNPVASHMDEAQPTAVLDPCLPDPYTLYKTESYDTVRVMIHKALDVR